LRPRRIFVAGSTGAVGQRVVALAAARGLSLLAHARPRPDRAAPEGAVVFALEDHAALVQALQGCTTVLQLVGTMKKRFASGDTYASSDVATTEQLVRAANEAGVDHVVLLSSVGAGRPVGAYLAAKARAEAVVRSGGVPFTIVRPSSFQGGGHEAPPGLGAVSRVPGLDALRPIAIDALAAALLHVASRRAPLGAIVDGEVLHALTAAA
jgi:uncharacterized protein YbjT (DUF2867 family)